MKYTIGEICEKLDTLNYLDKKVNDALVDSGKLDQYDFELLRDMINEYHKSILQTKVDI